jgi:Xaa-Pro aminopeptidase
MIPDPIRAWPPAAIAFITVAAVPLGAQTPEQRYSDWARPPFTSLEYVARRAALLDRLAASGGGVMLVPSADGVTSGDTFRQLDDFAYLTGLELPRSLLALDADEGTATLFLPARDARFENPGRPNDFPGRPLGEDPEVALLAGLDRAEDIRQLDQRVRAWAARGRLLVDAGHAGSIAAPHPEWSGTLGPIETLLLRLRQEAPNARVGNAFEHVARLRMVKSPAEVDALRRAAEATAAGIRAGARATRPGLDEATLQGVFEASCRERGSAHIPFTPIIKSGPNSLWPWRILAAHADRRNRTLESGDVVIFDVGCEADGYVSDVGRTFPVGGRFSPAQREKLDMITGVSNAIVAAVRPGVTFADLTRVAYESIPDDEEPYMQTPSYFGHHIGLSSGDPALANEPLAPGMVFTVEPWYYNHELGVSVFVEDVVLVTERGAELLTAGLPRTPRELEAMIR